MSLRLDMLQVARLAPNLLLEAGDRVIEFLHGQLNEDGGAKDRAGKSDLYYTVFAVEGLMAMGMDPPAERIVAYLRGFRDGDGLDLIHLACLARCWAAMPPGTLHADTARRILNNIESHRSADGGYSPKEHADAGTVYHSFLALGAYQDLDIADCESHSDNSRNPQSSEVLPNQDGLRRCLAGLQTDDGAYANRRGLRLGTTPVTAAAATLMRQLDMPVPRTVGEWLLARCHEKGGFLATPHAPFPDLLSTGTALHALAEMHVSFETVEDRCLDFLDSLWTGRAFCGHWADDALDCEYTFYALLALGHLSL